MKAVIVEISPPYEDSFYSIVEGSGGCVAISHREGTTHPRTVGTRRAAPAVVNQSCGNRRFLAVTVSV